MQRLTQFIVATVALFAAPTGPVAAGTDQTLGGGSDIRSGSVIELASGTTIGPSHHVFADNPGNEPIDVEFRAEAPAGVEITPELDQFTLLPGTSETDHFTIALDPILPPGEYPVTVQLVRTDITASAGSVTNVPAVGTSFTIRVIGDRATLNVEARSLESGLPVEGTLVLAVITDAEQAFEIDRVEGSDLSTTVAPGRYRGSYILDGRELASEETTVEHDQTATIRLGVNTISFALVDAEPVAEEGRVVVANLTASVNNHLRVIDGIVTIQAVVYRDDQLVDTAVLHQTSQLPIGITESTLVYRPDGGFQPGTYRFEYELIAPDFVLHASGQPTFAASQPATSMWARRSVVIAAGSLLAASAVVAGTWLTVKKRRV